MTEHTERYAVTPADATVLGKAILEILQQARAELVAKRYAQQRGDVADAQAHERKARRHLQSAKRLLGQVDDA